MAKRLLIDFSTLIIASAMSQRQDKIDEGMLRHLTINSILGARKKFKDYETVLCYDSGSYWRRDIFPGYKAHRRKARDASTFDWRSFYQYMDNIKVELREIFPYKVIELDGAEADDVIGTLALHADDDLVIYAEDQDFHQCLRNPNVKIYKPRKGVWVGQKPMYEVEYELFTKICQGDGGDGIPNIFSDINSIAEGVRQNRATKKRIDELFENGVGAGELLERYKLNKALIDLRETPKELKERILAAVEEPPKGSKGKIFQYLTEQKLMKHGANFLSDINLF